MEKEEEKTKEALWKDYWVEENDGDVLGNAITNLLESQLGIEDARFFKRLFKSG